jgi:hypothetical protein
VTSPIDVDSAVTSVARNFSSLFSTLRASMVQQLYAMWFGLDSYRDADLDRWFELSLPLIQAAQETSATATSTYMQMQLEIMGSDETITPPPMDAVTGPPIRGGVPLEEVYSRPFKEVWTGLSKGLDLSDAIDNGANRLRQLVETDIQLSHTHTSRYVIERTKTVTGFRRVPQGTFTCALCLIASTQKYHKFDLMPIHPGCDCRVAPMISETRGPQVVDREFLEEVHSAIEKQFGMSASDARKIDYRKILLERNHGEYGPTLTVAKYDFTGPNQLRQAA